MISALSVEDMTSRKILTMNCLFIARPKDSRPLVMPEEEYDDESFAPLRNRSSKASSMAWKSVGASNRRSSRRYGNVGSSLSVVRTNVPLSRGQDNVRPENRK